MKVFGKTDIGNVRNMNQDYLFYSTDPVGVLPNLFIVADGMGGHRAGDYASRLSVETFVEYVRNAENDVPIRVVDDAVRHVNKLILREAADNPDYAGMGTTFVVAFIHEDILYVANIGDSRLYLIDDQMTQVTEDHSYVATLVRAGEITREEAEHHPDKNIITRAIGAAREARVDFFEVDLEKGDRILMCTDGLTNMVSEEDILSIFAHCPIEAIVGELIEEAKRNGGSDNITAIVIDPYEEEAKEC